MDLMKKIKLGVLTSLVLISGCSTTLNKRFYTNPEDILFQQWAAYTPDECSMTKVYGGVLAIVGNELIFDLKQQSARPFSPRLSPFQIFKKQIMKIEISDKKSWENKSIIIQTYTGDYCFQIKASDAEKIYEIILNWHNTEIFE